jgi:hypothetical protein
MTGEETNGGWFFLLSLAPVVTSDWPIHPVILYPLLCAFHMAVDANQHAFIALWWTMYGLVMFFIHPRFSCVVHGGWHGKLVCRECAINGKYSS